MSHAEIVTRWTRLFSVPPLIQRWQDGLASATEQKIAEELIERWHLRLIDISYRNDLRDIQSDMQNRAVQLVNQYRKRR